MAIPPDFDALDLTEIIRLQNQLSAALKRRFERVLAVAFSDVVGSTAYFARFGDEDGGRLLQRHVDTLQQVLPAFGGRIVNTAGDGAFLCFAQVLPAVEAMLQIEDLILRDNARLEREHHLTVRIGLHWGPVLTDGVIVTGESVNLCARVAASANSGEIRLTKAAFMELPVAHRLRCRRLAPLALKGIAEPVEVVTLRWRDTTRFPTVIRVEETGEEIRLPEHDRITCGRLRELNGLRANDIVLVLPDPELTQRISRWHFELTREPEGMRLRVVSTRPTEVDGRPLAKDAEVPVANGTVVRLSQVMTLHFLSDEADESSGDETIALGQKMSRP
jgi:adenylate cyclase